MARNRVAAIAVVLLGLLILVAVTQGDEVSCDKAAGGAAAEDDREALESVIRLVLGSSEEAVLAFLVQASRRLEILHFENNASPRGPVANAKYDKALVLKLGRFEGAGYVPGRVYLYFKKGFLVAKCFQSDNEKINSAEIYRREIASGLQHPPNFIGLLKKAHWGKEKGPVDGSVPQGKAREISTEPRLRSGLVTDGFPPFAKKYGYNVLVLLQNVGPKALDVSVYLGPWGPALCVRGVSPDDPNATDGPTITLGIYGSRVRKFEEFWLETADLYLEPGEMTYQWGFVEELKRYKEMAAEWNNFFAWDAGKILFWENVESQKVAIK